MITFSMSDEQQAMYDTIHSFAKDEMRPLLRTCEEKEGLPEELEKKYHEMGLTTLDIPQEFGGQGLDSVTAAIVSEELAWGDVGMAMSFPGPGLTGYAIWELGTKEQKERYLPLFSQPDGYKRRGALALTEPDTGSAIRSLSTKAELQGRDYVLKGKKCMITNAGRADIYVVCAATGEGKSQRTAAFVVEKGTPGLVMGKKDEKLGLITAPSGEVILENCRVPRENMLGGEEDTKAGIDRFLTRARITHAARTVGMARASFEYALNYSKERVAFGKPIAQHQVIAFMLADMATEIDAARLLTWKAAWLLDKGQPAQTEASMALVQATEMATRVTIDAVQILAGHGYIQDHPVEKWMRDARTMAMVVGTTQVQNIIIGRGISA